MNDKFKLGFKIRMLPKEHKLINNILLDKYGTYVGHMFCYYRISLDKSSLIPQTLCNSLESFLGWDEQEITLKELMELK